MESTKSLHYCPQPIRLKGIHEKMDDTSRERMFRRGKAPHLPIESYNNPKDI
jgi:hypothetical protein